MTGPDECFYIGDAQYPEEILANHLRRKKTDMSERPDAAPPKDADQIRRGEREADHCPFCGVDELHWPTLRVVLACTPEVEPVAWRWRFNLKSYSGRWCYSDVEPTDIDDGAEVQPLYASSPEVTDEMVERACRAFHTEMVEDGEVSVLAWDDWVEQATSSAGRMSQSHARNRMREVLRAALHGVAYRQKEEIKMHGFIKKLVDLSNTSKLANWSSHGLAVSAFAAGGWVFGDPITGVNLGGAIYLWRELEAVTMKWAATGKLKILEDNLGDLVGPVIVVAFVHLLA